MFYNIRKSHFVNRTSRWVSAFVGILFSALLFTQCAQQGTLTGGDKDTIPPSLVKTNPGDKARNFKGTELDFTFDEYVQVENLQQELIITPDAQMEYESKPTKYGVRLIFKKPFKDSTTYTLNFRNAIKDITEKNASRDAKLVFSTGAGLDTLVVNGRVMDLQSGKPAENAVVSLYRADDTLDVKKNKPYYFTRTDKQGNYAIENIRPGNYRMYALGDKNNNQRYDNEKEKFAFLPQTLNLRDSSRADVNFKMDIVDETLPKVSRRTTQSDLYLIEMNEGLTNANIRLSDSTKNLAYAIDSRDPKVIRLYNTLQVFDSLQVNVEAQDSAGNVLETAVKIKFEKLDEKKRRNKTKIAFDVKTEPGNNEPVLRDLAYTISFSKPVTRYDFSKIQLLADTITPIPLDSKTELIWNDAHTQLSFKKRIDIRKSVRFVAPKETFFSVEGDTAAAIKNDHELKDPEKFGSIAGRIQIAAKHYIVQLVTTDGKVVAQLRNQPNYIFRYLQAGDYQLRVVIDRNNNGQWDAASFKEKIPAEDIIYKPEKIKLKENWELTEQNISV